MKNGVMDQTSYSDEVIVFDQENYVWEARELRDQGTCFEITGQKSSKASLFFRPEIRLVNGRHGALAVPAPDYLTCERI